MNNSYIYPDTNESDTNEKATPEQIKKRENIEARKQFKTDEVIRLCETLNLSKESIEYLTE